MSQSAAAVVLPVASRSAAERFSSSLHTETFSEVAGNLNPAHLEHAARPVTLPCVVVVIFLTRSGSRQFVVPP